ncbi:MAG: TIGR02300 family protein [Hyphomicrobiales bacterium]|nr:TIGR02300 family protein [Hyphomicrobiales bacterium]
MAKPELGIKRVCPVTGRKFYDLNRDPVVSPYSGQAYPRAYFEPQAKAPAREEADEEEIEVAPVELVALEEADAPDAGAKDVVAVEDIDEDIVADDEEDTFLEADEEDDDDVSDLIDGDIVDDEET